MSDTTQNHCDHLPQQMPMPPLLDEENWHSLITMKDTLPAEVTAGKQFHYSDFLDMIA